MTRRRLSTLQRAKLFEAHHGLCHLCGEKIGVGEAWEIEHIIPVAMGGEDEDDNCAPAHVKCHAAKTKKDRAQIAKANRVRAKHMGAHRPKSVIPGSRSSRFKRKISGEVVER